MTKLLLSTSLFALGLAASASAQPAADQASTNVGELVVTATRVPTDKLKVADSVTVITAKDIALKEQQSLPEVLADAPGLNVVQTGGQGGLTSVYMRGTNPNHVKVLVDGIDVSDPSSSNGVFDFGQFLTPDIERVEILRGPQSGLYGSDAIGGVINIITKSGEGPPHLDAILEGGSFDTFNQSAALGGSTGPFHYMATVEHLHSGATPVTPKEDLAPGEARKDDYYDNFSASTKLGYDVTSNFNLGLVARYTDSHLRSTGDDDLLFTNSGAEAPDPVQSRTDDRQYYVRATGHGSLFDGRFEQTFGVAYSNVKSADIFPDFGTLPVVYDTSVFNGDRVKLDWQGAVKLASTETLVIGAEHQHDTISQPTSAHVNIESGYAELQSNPFKDFNDTLSVRYDSNSQFGGQTTWRVAPTYFIESTGTKLEATVGTGFKAPSLSDLYQNFPSFGFFGNPDLRPERSTGYDIGFEQYLLDRRLQFGATWYYNHITNLIEDNATFTSLANIGKAHTQGVESFILIQPLKTLSFRVDYTYTEARDDILHQTLVRRPSKKWNLDARWQATSKLSFDADLLSVSSWIDGNRDFSIPRLTAPGYTTVDMTANYDVNSRITVYGRITNLFDARYQEPFGFLAPSQGFFVGLKAHL